MDMKRERTYRPRRYFRNLGIVGLVFTLTMWSASVAAVLFDVDGSFWRPGLAIAFFSVCWGGVTLAGVWLVAWYARHRLVVSDSTVLQSGVFGSKQVAFDAIQEAKWRLTPQGGRIVLTGQASSVKIEFGSYTPTERRELFSILRECIGDQRHAGWEEFHDRFIVPSPEWARQQRFVRRIMVLAVFAFGVTFAVLWVLGQGTFYLVLSLVNVLAGLWAVAKGRGPTDNAT